MKKTFSVLFMVVLFINKCFAVELSNIYIPSGKKANLAEGTAFVLGLNVCVLTKKTSCLKITPETKSVTAIFVMEDTEEMKHETLSVEHKSDHYRLKRNDGSYVTKVETVYRQVGSGAYVKNSNFEEFIR
ncbi:hypothetical protein [Alteromonas antoniana]|uniref:hypothetical protein n=1 Tax=Alteromonas antoniana TaxID=2803813 RepID=UPI001C46196E|nr:hypothetical protein [Alteromonas antoniana]